MSIGELSDHDKSVMIAKAMGWETVTGNETLIFIPGETHHGIQAFVMDFYDPANMRLAWRVLNWAEGHAFWIEAMGTRYEAAEIDSPFEWAVIRRLPPADAQRLWLDRILTLAIEAGLVEVNDEPQD